MSVSKEFGLKPLLVLESRYNCNGHFAEEGLSSLLLNFTFVTEMDDVWALRVYPQVLLVVSVYL